MKSKKFSLIACGASFVLCSAALVGTTLAWFTDEAANKNNILQAGDLSVDLLQYKDTAYESIKDQDAIFQNEGFKWEPGRSQVFYLAIENKGDVSLDYSFDIEAEGDLVSALEYGIVEKEVTEDSPKFTSWSNAGFSTVENLNVGSNTVAEGYLDGGASIYYCLAVRMRTDADNTYRKTSANLSLTVRAKQHAGTEEDGFGDGDYDGEADKNVIEVSDAAEFVTDLSNASEGDVLKLASGITLDGNYNIPEGVEVDGNGATLAPASGIAMTLSEGSIVSGFNFKGGDGTYAILANENADGAVIENNTFEGTPSTMNHAVWLQGADNVTIRNNNTSRPIQVNGEISGLKIQNNTFSNGLGENGITVSSEATVSDSSVTGNTYNSYCFSGLNKDELLNLLGIEESILNGLLGNYGMTVDSVMEALPGQGTGLVRWYWDEESQKDATVSSLNISDNEAVPGTVSFNGKTLTCTSENSIAVFVDRGGKNNFQDKLEADQVTGLTESTDVLYLEDYDDLSSLAAIL